MDKRLIFVIVIGVLLVGTFIFNFIDAHRFTAEVVKIPPTYLDGIMIP